MPNNSPLRVHSHKRSGTHLLMAEIVHNFDIPDMSEVVKIRANQFVLNGKSYSGGEEARIPWGKLFGSHKVYNGRPDGVLYIVRHPIPTLVSLWRLTGQKTREINNRLGKDAIETWKKHVVGYTENCHWVRYEDLVGENHDKVLGDIENWFGLKRKQPEFYRVKDRLGWYVLGNMVKDNQPTPEIVQGFIEAFPEGFLGYDMHKYGKAFINP